MLASSAIISSTAANCISLSHLPPSSPVGDVSVLVPIRRLVWLYLGLVVTVFVGQKHPSSCLLFPFALFMNASSAVRTSTFFFDFQLF